MKNVYLILFVVFGMASQKAFSQESYFVTSGEMIYSQSITSFTPQFMAKYPDARVVNDNMRFTMFFHLGEYFHHDFGNSFGLYTGLGIRNVGMITDESLPVQVDNSTTYQDYKIIRRQYTLGLPLALKLGSFSKNFFVFAGGEMEMAFHFKEKYWDSFERSGNKTKNTKWFGNQTPTFMPSAFVGIQLPGGFHVQLKYYLNDFLDSGYQLSQNSGDLFNLSDLTRYNESQVFYFSICWQLKNSEMFE